MHKQPLAVCFLVLLLAGLAGAAAKDQLGPELPGDGNVPALSGLGVDERVVVLQVCAKALGLESDPQRILVHCVCLVGPIAKVVCVDGWRWISWLLHELMCHVYDVIRRGDLRKALRRFSTGSGSS